MILYDTDNKNKIKMSKKSRTLINAETNLIRKMLEQN